MERNPAAGFSLIELMVAMVITLIVVGSMVGLLTSGQSAFSTQPERTDRQQNMRVAMDVIMRDVAAAGVGLPNPTQVFTPGLDNLGPRVGVDGVSLTDELEMVTNTSGFDNEDVCRDDSGTDLELRKSETALAAGMTVSVLFENGTWTLRRIAAASTGATASGAACSDPSHQSVTLDSDPCSPGAPPFGNAGSVTMPACGATPCCKVIQLGLARVIRYRIGDTDGDAIPDLERSENGGAFQILARGIEDLQVQYVQSDGNWPATTGTVANVPVAVDPANLFTTLTTEVRITLSARTVRQRIQGATTIAGDATTMALRGSLVGTASPRQALWVLNQQTPTARWN